MGTNDIPSYLFTKNKLIEFGQRPIGLMITQASTYKFSLQLNLNFLCNMELAESCSPFVSAGESICNPL